MIINSTGERYYFAVTRRSRRDRPTFPCIPWLKNLKICKKIDRGGVFVRSDEVNVRSGAIKCLTGLSKYSVNLTNIPLFRKFWTNVQ